MITQGPDGNLWFTENAGNKIAAINPITHVFSEFAVPQSGSNPYGITIGPDNNVWFTEANANRLGRLNLTTDAITTFAIPGNGQPRGITGAPDSTLWFTEVGTNQVGVIYLPSDTIGMMNVPTASSSPAGIGMGPGGSLWFAESNASQIGEILSTPTITTQPVSQTVPAGQTVTFTAAATGLPAPTVQWQVSTDGGQTFTPLANTGAYSGVATGTLTITNPTATMTGSIYEAVFANGINLTTVPATLTVNNALSLTPAPQGVLGNPYDATLSVVGSTSAFTLFAVNNFNAGGTGLTFNDITANAVNGTIMIAGTPTAAGIATFTVSVANSAGNSLTQNVSIVINPPLGIVTTTLPPATAGTPYTQTIGVIGGAMPYTAFAVSNLNAGTTGLTPASIVANAAAGTFTVSAVPSAGGTATFTVTVTDSAGTTVTRDFTLTVKPALAITPSLPQGTAGTGYNHTLTVTGGGVPYTSLTVTLFNAGTTGLTASNITVNVAAGTVTLNGMPLAAGTIKFTVNVVDSLGAALNQAYTVTINRAMTITPSLPQGTAGALYQQAIMVTDGSVPYTTFSVTGFSAGGTGLTAAAVVAHAATGTFSIIGMPTAAGTASFTVNIADSAGASISKTYSITVNPPLTLGNLSVTQWTVGLAGFTGTMGVAGGSKPIAIIGASGLPTGMSFTLVGNSIDIVGTPTKVGVFSAGAVVLQDAAGAVVSKSFSITINAAPAVGNLTAAQWTVGRPGFNGLMAVNGGTNGLHIAASAGLPTGMSLALANNLISFTGTPTVTGTFNASVTLRDAIGASVVKTFTVTINAAPTIGNLSVRQWTAGLKGFTGTLAISAGTTPHGITAQSGLPPGLSAVISGTTIKFTGTPTTAGVYSNCSITTRDAAGATVTKTFSMTINPPVQIATASVPASAIGVPYSTTLHSTGGTGAVAFAVTAGTLPPGYHLTSTGQLSGVCRGMGSFTFTVAATDAIGASISRTYTLVVARIL
jgi:hypothetical protein